MNSAYQTIWLNATNSSYSLRVTTRDSAGNVATDNASIIVNAMPKVMITNPAVNLQSYNEVTRHISLGVDASDSDGTITNVEFYSGTNFLGSTMNSPYSIVWNNRAAAYYGVTAVATDDRGAKGVSRNSGVQGGPYQSITSSGDHVSNERSDFCRWL